jgi:hypothetical protein
MALILGKPANLLGTVLAAAVGLGVLIFAALFIGFYVIRPRRVMHRFDEFCARHPVGSSFAELIDDSFVTEVSMAGDVGPALITLGSKDKAALTKLRAGVKARPSGSIELTWTHTPPFGRLILDVKFDAGRVTGLRQSELD